MRAVIRVPEPSRAPLFSIAGKPLIVRQLQWLRAVGCDQVVIELGDDATGDAVAGLIADTEVAFDGLVLVSTAERLSDRALARRGGIPDDAPFLLLPGDVIGEGDLTILYVAADASGVQARYAPPAELAALAPATVTLVHGSERPRRLVRGRGWVARVTREADALAIGAAVLAGRLPRGEETAWPIQVHAAEIRPGVWVARGAVIDPSATLVPPVLVGPFAHVRARATVGPTAEIGAGAEIGADATVAHAEVEPQTVVADGLDVRDVVAGPARMTMRDGELIPVDALLLARAGGTARFGSAGRAAALALLLLAAPLVTLLAPARGRALTRDLLEVFAGRRALVGVRGPRPDVRGAPASLVASASECPDGLFDVSRALAPADADPLTWLRARAWYAHAKSPWLDLRLCARLLTSRGRTA